MGYYDFSLWTLSFGARLSVGLEGGLRLPGEELVSQNSRFLFGRCFRCWSEASLAQPVCLLNFTPDCFELVADGAL